jgi:hypothetical protein
MKMGFEPKQAPRRAAPPMTRAHREHLERKGALAPYRYRVMIFDRAVTPWRSDEQETLRDAVRGGHGTVCEQTGILFMTVPAWIQWEKLERSPA